MFKISVVLLAVGYAVGSPLSQEELAQYVARQQTAGLPRRQAYVGGAGAGPQPRQIKPQYQPAPQPQYQPAPQPQYQPAPQAYQQDDGQYYQPQYVAQQPGKKLVQRPGALLKGQEPQEDYDPNPQYQFGFDIKDDEFTNYQHRNEQREGNKITGSYSVVDADGYIRTVKYTADPLEGFKADVSREPTDIKVKFPVPTQLVPQDQYQFQQPTLRKQQAQQYLQASEPIQGKQQYAVRPEQLYQDGQPKQLAYTAPQLQATKAYQAKVPGGYQPGPSPVLYQAYQQ